MKKVWSNSGKFKELLREKVGRRKTLSVFRQQGQLHKADWSTKEVLQQAIREELVCRESTDVLQMEHGKEQPGILMLFQGNCIGGVYYMDSNGNFYDEVSNRRLDNAEVEKARLEELRQVYKFKVYDKVPIKECYDATGKEPIGVRWLDINKGDESNKDYRSRLVAQEIKKDKREDLFAPTPPLEAKKLLFSLAVTEGYGYIKGNEKNGMKIDFVDISRAFFHADAIRKVYVKLAPEDAEEGMCGRLNKSMYGTRDAAQNWGETYMQLMQDIGFTKGKSSPCTFHHARK